MVAKPQRHYGTGSQPTSASRTDLNGCTLAANTCTAALALSLHTHPLGTICTPPIRQACPWLAMLYKPKQTTVIITNCINELYTGGTQLRSDPAGANHMTTGEAPAVLQPLRTLDAHQKWRLAAPTSHQLQSQSYQTMPGHSHAIKPT